MNFLVQAATLIAASTTDFSDEQSTVSSLSPCVVLENKGDKYNHKENPYNNFKNQDKCSGGDIDHPGSIENSSDLQSNNTSVDRSITELASRHYARTLRQVSQKLVLRMSTSVKRSLCKKCHGFLIPGFTTSSFKVSQTGRRKKLSSTCHLCGARKEKIICK
jgi:RNase P subunit RPR2